MTNVTAERFIVPKLKSLPPSGIRRFFDLVAGTPGVISLGVGEPDFVTPWHIREACLYSLERGYTMYTSNSGLPQLRKEIARYCYTRFDLEYNYDNEILVTIGASEAVDLALRTVINDGDEVLIPEPSYVSYKPCTVLAGGIPISVETTADHNFKLVADNVKAKISPKTKALILCYPNNPTGAVMKREDLEPIAQLACEHDLLVISDEIYAELTYGSKHVSIASLPGMRERTVVIGGFSKAFAMTGWRIGFVMACRQLIAAMVKIHQYTILCAPIMGQMAAVEALQNGECQVSRMVKEYNRRRRFVVSRFNEIGLDCFEPAGAFYAFPSIKKSGMKSEEFAERLLKEEKVAVVPGTAFGSSGEGHIRCSYAASMKQLREAMNRIERFVERIIKEA